MNEWFYFVSKIVQLIFYMKRNNDIYDNYALNEIKISLSFARNKAICGRPFWGLTDKNIHHCCWTSKWKTPSDPCPERKGRTDKEKNSRGKLFSISSKIISSISKEKMHHIVSACFSRGFNPILILFFIYFTPLFGWTNSNLKKISHFYFLQFWVPQGHSISVQWKIKSPP